MPSNSLAATLPGSTASAASESPLVDEQDPLALVAFVGGKPQTAKRFGGGGGGGGALAFPVEQRRAEGDVAVAGGGGEEGFSGGPCGSRHWSLCLAITARLISSWL